MSTINYCIIGIYASGKTSLVKTFVKNKTSVDNDSTIGAAFIVNYANIGGKITHMSIWDTAGQERYAMLLPMYSRNADVIIFTIDPLNADSVKYIKKMLPVIIEPRRDVPPIAINIVVTKMDTQYNDQIAKEMVEEVVKFIRGYLGADILVNEYYTSANTCYNVDLPFIDACDTILQRKVARMTIDTTNIVSEINMMAPKYNCIACGI